MIVSTILMSAIAASGTSCLPVETEVSLTGRLRYQWESGPPNYGETPNEDKRLRIGLLELDPPISVCADNFIQDEAASDIEVIQLAYEKGLKPGRVTVHGKLFFGHTGWHFTKVLMAVETADGRSSD